MLVRTLTTHTQPGSGRYREEGEEFEYPGPLYKHVEPVEPEQKKRGKAGKQDDEA